MSVGAILARLEHAAPGRAKAELFELRKLLRAAPVDAVELARVEKALERHSAIIPESSARWAPRAGESYVLLIGAGGPTVGRLSVTREGPPHVVRGDVHASSLEQAHLVLEVLAQQLAAKSKGIPEMGEHGHRFEVRTPDGSAVDGASLGVAAAVGLVSCWTRRTPLASYAATAAVNRDGTLRAVRGVDEKLAALRARYPEVTHVVVAPGQEVDRVPEGITLERHESLVEALRSFGLDLANVQATVIPSAQNARILRELEGEHELTYSAERWRAHAMRARLCAAHPRVSPAQRAQALGWAALYHLHAGDAAEGQHLAESIGDADIDQLSGSSRVWVRIIKATAAIDEPGDAVSLSRRALDDAQKLKGSDADDLLGRALGTLGRALMHALEPASAVPHLEASVAHHRERSELEVPRSLNYLATALRRANRHADALAAVDEALSIASSAPGESQYAISLLFSHYERARILYELERYDEARDDLLAVLSRQARDDDYPSVGCLRYLAAIALRTDQRSNARDYLERACRIAERTSRSIREVAAAAAGEALLLGPVPEGFPDLRAIWAPVAGDRDDREALKAIVY
jgi:tetratricopeptide (TPR) repeat protein